MVFCTGAATPEIRAAFLPVAVATAGTDGAPAPETGPPLPATPVDRRAGEGPPRCCERDVIAADMLVWVGGLSEDALARVRAAIPRLVEAPVEELYLCDGCRERLLRRGVLTPEELPRWRAD